MPIPVPDQARHLEVQPPVDTAKPAGPDDPVRRELARQVTELRTWDRAVRADADDAVHQMRVTIRIIRSLLKESTDHCALDDGARVHRELRELARVLGEARDAEVLAERYERALSRLDAGLVRGPVRRRLVDGARERYRLGLRRSQAAMNSERYFRLLAALDALDATAANRPMAAEGEAPVPVTLDHAYRRVRKAAKAARRAAAGTPESGHDEHRRAADEALHRIRKYAKRLRYTAAAIGATDVAQRSKTVQSLLGDHQDSVVSREHLLVQADTARAAGEDTLTYELLYQQEAALAEYSRRLLGPALAELRTAMREYRR